MFSMTTRNLELQTRSRIRSDIEHSTVIQERHRKRLGTRAHRAPLFQQENTQLFSLGFIIPLHIFSMMFVSKAGDVDIRL